MMKAQPTHPSPSLSGRLLSIPMVTWIAVALVVVAVWIAVLLASGSGPSTPKATPRASTPSTASAHFVYERPYRLSSGKYLTP